MRDTILISAHGDDYLRILGWSEQDRTLAPDGYLDAPGGPGAIAFSPHGEYMYVATRRTPAVHCYHRRGKDWCLAVTVELAHDPCFLCTDRSGRFLLTSYYQAGGVTVHKIGPDGAPLATGTFRYETDVNAHMCSVDPGNRFVFVPHTGPNFIARFCFNETTGGMIRAAGHRPHCPHGAGPRHMRFHPTGRWAFTSNELASSVSVYEYRGISGELHFLSSHSTLPADYTGANTCGQIHLSPDGNAVCVSNRGHDSIACFDFNAATSTLSPTGYVSTGSVPRAFCLDPSGRFLCAASQANGTLTVAGLPGNRELPLPIEYDSLLRATANPLWVCVVPATAP